MCDMAFIEPMQCNKPNITYLPVITKLKYLQGVILILKIWVHDDINGAVYIFVGLILMLWHRQMDINPQRNR